MIILHNGIQYDLDKSKELAALKKDLKDDIIIYEIKLRDAKKLEADINTLYGHTNLTNAYTS